MSTRQFQIPIILVVFLVVVAVVNGFAGVYHWFWVYRWFDMPMHFSGGMWLAGFGSWWQYFRRGVRPESFYKLLWVCFVYALSIGLLWEVYEAVVSFITVHHMNAILDTMGDLLFDILGGITVAVLVWRWPKLI